MKKQVMQDMKALQEEQFDRLTREGLQDIKDGKVVDHAQMQAWCDSLDSEQPLPMPL